MSRRLLWSISTTVRNPARLRDFLRVLQRFEGRPYDSQTQKEYQIALIQERLYQPSKIPPDLEAKFLNYENPLDWDDARKIFEAQEYVDPAMRGRQSINPLNKLGLAVALKQERIQITPVGQLLLSDEAKASEIIFISLLKLQYPNPLNRDFSESRGFNIIPMIAVLRLLDYLRSKGKIGLTREEFCFFVPTWIDANNLHNQAERIIEFSKLQGQKRENFVLALLRDFYNEPIAKKDTRYKNLFDYGDNAMRYFRFTKYFSVRSSTPFGSWTIDIEPTRQREVEILLREHSGTARSFKNLKDYLAYLGDPSQPLLPWKHATELRQIIIYLQQKARALVSEEHLNERQREILNTPSASLTLPVLEQWLTDLRNLIREASISFRQKQMRWNPTVISKLADDLLNIRRKGLDPADLEKLIFDLLIALDDEVAITPNYPMDDMGNPISHAPGNRADIECLYSEFHMIVEVTLDSSRFQWIREGQPVMRHLRDFEQRFPNSAVFCLFLAPRVHQDTYSQFWFAVRYEYDGRPQRIVPFDFDQFVAIVQSVLRHIQKYQSFSHHWFYELLDSATARLDALSGYNEWRQHIQSVVQEWCRRVEQ